MDTLELLQVRLGLVNHALRIHILSSNRLEEKRRILETQINLIRGERNDRLGTCDKNPTGCAAPLARRAFDGPACGGLVISPDTMAKLSTGNPKGSNPNNQGALPE